MSPVEIAHIVPWSEVRTHEFDNLIALCPNDHTRYDRGDIDRLSMYKYKSNLAELTGRYGYFEVRVLHYFAARPDTDHFVCAGGLELLFQGLIDDSLLSKPPESQGGISVQLENRDDVSGEVLGVESLSLAEVYLLTEKGRSLVTAWANAKPLDG